MFFIKRLLPFFYVLFLLMNPASAHAEIPIVEPGDYGTFANPQWVAYPRNMSFVMGKLASADDLDVVAFDYVGGQLFNALVYVPAHEELRDFSPYIALVGPGLPAPTQTLPFAVPQGMGAIVAHSTQTYRYFDVFTQMTFFPRAQINTTLPQTGRYYMAVWGQPVGRSLYALDIGIEETFAPQFLMRYPINWFQVRSSLEWGYRPLALLPVLVWLVFVAVGKYNRRKAQRATLRSVSNASAPVSSSS